MTLLNPQKPYADWWEFHLWASAGGHKCEIINYDDDSTEVIVDYRMMGQKTHQYQLTAEHTRLSDDYGHIIVEHVKMLSPNPKTINISSFEGGIVFEYFRVAQSPHVQHPHDMLNMSRDIGNAGWNGYFDIYLVLYPFVDELIDSLRWMYDNPSEEYEKPDIQSVEIITDVLKRLDKRKFRKMKSLSGSEPNVVDTHLDN